VMATIARLPIGVVAALALYVQLAGAAGGPDAGAAGLRTGCDRSRPAVAYRPGGAALSPQPGRRPAPCLAVIPERTSESAMVAIAPSGRVFYAPLVQNDYPAPLDDRGPALVAASDDGGRRWQALDSGGTDHILDVPPWMARDPQTGRIWFASVLPPLCGAEVSWSDDDGRTWQTNPVVGCPGMGSMRILEGPAPAGGASPTGYRHVVYYCANLNDFEQSNMWCFRSLDGGHSFAFTGSFPDPPPRPGCATRHPARPGAVGPDGVLYFPVFMCGDLSVAISRDEGASWQLTPVAHTDVQDLYISSMAADQAGNVYLAWIAGTGGAAAGAGTGTGGPNPATEAILGAGIPSLSISRDHGATWSSPAAVGPPGVSDARHIAIAADAAGRVAISFLANGDNGPTLSGYLSETDNALAAEPVWWSAPLNDPATPLISTTDSETFGDRLFNFNDAFAPDGEAWAAFHCAKTSACSGQRIGVVGRLAPAPAPSAGPTSAAPGSVKAPCVDRRRFRFRLHHARGARVVRVTAFVNGRRVLVRRGHDITSLRLRRLPLGIFRVKIVSRQSTGALIVSRRTYRGCRKGRPTSRGRRRRHRR